MEQSLYELLRRCTVRVSLRGKTGHGTGFYAAPGLILTCAHVIESIQFNEDTVEVYWNGLPHPARIMTLAAHADLALLQVDVTDHPCVLLDEQALPSDNFYSFGYPDDHADGDPATFVCEGWSGEQQDHLKFKIGQVRPGMSGAALLNMRQVVFVGLFNGPATVLAI
jgi:hypothetical protein